MNHRFELHLHNGALFAAVEAKQLKIARKQILTEVAHALKQGIDDFQVKYVDLRIHGEIKPAVWKDIV